MIEQYKHYKVEQTYNNKILVITLNRPPVNAFIKESYEELSDIMNLVSYSEEICVVLFKSDGKLFSAGADVKQLGVDNPQEAAVRRAKLRKAGADFYSCPVPVVAAVNGAAVGAGAVFAASSDIILADENAFFSIPEINVGVVGGAKGLSRLVPPQKVRAMALTGKKVTAKEIYGYGGIEKITTSDQLHQESMKYAEEIADKGYIALRKWKESLLLTEQVGPREGLLIEQCFSQELALFSPKPTIK